MNNADRRCPIKCLLFLVLPDNLFTHLAALLGVVLEVVEVVVIVAAHRFVWQLLLDVAAAAAAAAGAAQQRVVAVTEAVRATRML